MKLTRRDFLKGLAAGLAVASLPKTIPIAESTEAVTEILHAPGWRFIIRGGSGGVGDSLIILAPGTNFVPWMDWQGRTFIWPQQLPDLMAEEEINQPITLMPWRPYQKQIEALIPDDMMEGYEAAKRWRR